MSLHKTTEMPVLRPTLPPPFDYAVFALCGTYAPQRGAVGSKVFCATPDVPWNALGAIELEVIRLLDGVMPVALVETMTALSTDDLYPTIAILLARGFITECQAPIVRRPFLELVDDDASLIPVSMTDFVDVEVRTSVIPLSTVDFIEVRFAA
jgi:hypothetical protein